MNRFITKNEILELTRFITHTCENILFKYGPFLKEGVYQDILVHKLQQNSIATARELVFPYNLKTDDDENIYVGNCQSLRSDIELPTFYSILELKSSGSATKDENIFQLRNYLENREDRNWGLLINFISKFTQNTSSKVQVTLLMKMEEGTQIQVQNSQHNLVKINRYYRYDLETLEYPNKNQLFVSMEDTADEDYEEDMDGEIVNGQS